MYNVSFICVVQICVKCAIHYGLTSFNCTYVHLCISCNMFAWALRKVHKHNNIILADIIAETVPYVRTFYIS